MDWPKARAIMIIAFTLVNMVLVYSIWGPAGASSSADAPRREQVEQLRTTLADRGVTLPPNTSIPVAPEFMQFLHVAYYPTPDFVTVQNEVSVGTDVDSESDEPSIDPVTGALIFRPQARGDAATAIKLDNIQQVQEVSEEYLRQNQLLPPQAMFLGVTPQGDGSIVLAEWVPTIGQYPVFSGSVQVELSVRGIETVRWMWVQARRFTEAVPKAVRPASEALLRLAGRLGPSPTGESRIIREIRLGYYAGRSFAEVPAGEVNGWDTVPVWRIQIQSGSTYSTYYINAFNGEWES